MKNNLEMKNQSLDLHPETKRLMEEHDELKKQLSELFMQKQNKELHEKPLLIALYLQKIGYKEYNLYRLNVELAKLKQRLALMQAYDLSDLGMLHGRSERHRTVHTRDILDERGGTPFSGASMVTLYPFF